MLGGFRRDGFPISACVRSRVSSNISSEGFECCSTEELGDALLFTHGANKLKRVAIIMSAATQKERLTCLPTGDGNRGTGAYYTPATGSTIITPNDVSFSK